MSKDYMLVSLFFTVPRKGLKILKKKLNKHGQINHQVENYIQEKLDSKNVSSHLFHFELCVETQEGKCFQYGSQGRLSQQDCTD